jgi:medium-chain acyl-CoA synthetase
MVAPDYHSVIGFNTTPAPMRAEWCEQWIFEMEFMSDLKTKPPLHYNFTRDVIFRSANEAPGKRAILWVDHAGVVSDRSFLELWQAVARTSSVLIEAGIRRGDTVLILLSREKEWWEVMLACLQIGAIASPATIQLTPKDIIYRCQAGGMRCVIGSETIAENVDIALAASDIPKIHIGGARLGWIDYNLLHAAVSPHRDFVDTTIDDDAICYFTSGTTGHPKMAIHGHGYTLAHQVTGAHWLDLTAEDLHWNLSDTGWAKAAWSSLFGPWQQRAAIFVYHAPSFDAAATLHLLARFPITTLCAPPTAYRMFVRGGLNEWKFPALRHCVSAGEPLNPEVIDLWRAATGLEIYDGYGQTETIVLCANRPGATRQGSMGLPIPGTDLAVLDDEAAILGPGIEGDIALRVSDGYPLGLFKGYRGDPERTASVFLKGWYLTGDRAFVDHDGYFWFVGRQDDVILSSGYRIGPFEIESVLFEHAAVAESAVVSSPDPTRGEVVMAYIVLAAGREASEALVKELQDYVKATTAPYKYPRKIKFVESLPKTISGKIRRKDLRDIEWKRSVN